ncbi:aminotransferase class I/II-fold pyridoxal phosphate-dependent enzyme [bacterium]|nr:aminotransferase class I/II-fold pyridoxal phosphate-dependent enzyme [bacterium]
MYSKQDKIALFTSNCDDRNDTIRKAKAIVDSDVVAVMSTVDFINDSTDHSILFDQFAFTEKYDSWIHSSEKFKISGLETFPHRLVTNGITEAFGDIYERYDSIQVMRGEYTYHRDLGHVVLDDYKDIEEHSALIISYPFSATGNVHPEWDKIIAVCNERDIDVFIDCCLFGVSEVDTLDLHHDCITHVAFSFSKTFGTGGLRTGMLYKKNINNTTVEMINSHFYTQMAGMRLHYELMQQFTPDYMCDKYRDKQVELAKSLDIEPSDTVIFGISTDKKYDHFERDAYINRLCLSYALQEYNVAYEDFK